MKLVKATYLHLYIHLHFTVAHQDTWLCVSDQKVVQHTNVLFTGTTKSQVSTPRISITTLLISTYFVPSIYSISLTTKIEYRELYFDVTLVCS